MYTTNELLSHPLVSPILQPTLGGLPPLLIMVGGGEMLRDEQIYLAHKCTDPAQHLPPEELLDEKARALIERYKPTDVQLQVWDDLCHVGPTLSFTKPAKYMYRVCRRPDLIQNSTTADPDRRAWRSSPPGRYRGPKRSTSTSSTTARSPSSQPHPTPAAPTNKPP